MIFNLSKIRTSMLSNSFALGVISCIGLFSASSFAASPVAVETIEQAKLHSNLSVHGTLYGKQDVTLTSGVAGRLTFVATPGQLVNKNDMLAKIDLLPLQLAKAKQEVMLERAKINLTFQKQELARLKRLAKSNSAAATQVDQAQNQHDLTLTDIKLAEIELKVIEDQLNRAVLKAPFSGVVNERYERAGSEINRAQPLVSLIDINNLEVRLYVPVKYLKYLSLGNELQLSAGQLDDPKQALATVTAVIPVTDPRAQSFEVRADLLANDTQSWASGQLVDVVVPLSSNTEELIVNRDALILRQQGVHIVKIKDDNTAEHVAVIVGKGQGDQVAIKAKDKGALKVGDRIAIRGAETLAQGQEVEIQPTL
ncbi:efflux RND transporter periplasmic adaptor subunit [Pseudoalteromonas phenolica]|nr:efflux RND transporter periplasmic adaptor subunit [Pseudoalteromonas phenolica]